MVKIIADSTCDLSKDLIERYHVGILPLHILLGDKEYEDGSEISTSDIFKWADENKSTPKTSAPSLEKAGSMMKTYLDAGDEIICFSISDEMSTTCNVMRMAAASLDGGERTAVINSKNLSTGIGLLVIEAAVMAEEGKTKDEIVSIIEGMKSRVNASFLVSTLTYLHRGGRLSGAAAMAGSILKLHPKIVVTDGKMHADKKYRGSMERALNAYIEDMREELMHAKADRVFITHSDCEASIVSKVRSELLALNHFDEVLETNAGGVISSHCGPGTLGVLYIDGE